MEDESIKSAAANAAQNDQGDDLRDAIKQITLNALANRQLDKENLKRVVDQVLAGVTLSLNDSQERLKPALEYSLKGIDEALAKSVLASQLAAEEVLATSEKFMKQDFKPILNDLASIEDLLFESLNLAASKSGNLGKTVLEELSSHFRNTGTKVGGTAVESIKSLTHALEISSKHSVSEVSHVSRDLAINLAKVGSGILAGMSEAMHSKKPK